LPTLNGYAALLQSKSDWNGAFKVYQSILLHHRDRIAPDEIVDVYYQLGSVKRSAGDDDKAVAMFEKGLEVNGYHEPTLEAMIDLYGRRHAWDRVISAKKSLTMQASEDKRFETYTEISEIYSSKMKNYDGAIEAAEEALVIRPDDQHNLHNLVELYSTSERWKKAVDSVVRLADVEPDQTVRSKYLYSAAVISRDKVGEMDDAIQYFDSALDAEFSGLSDGIELTGEHFKAFEAIDKICTQRKDWKQQERSYRKMIKRLPPTGQNQWKVRLFHALGEVYRSRLNNMEGAIAAFEVAAQLEPSNAGRYEILADLYSLSGPEHSQKAVGAYQAMIETSPFNYDAYHRLAESLMRGKNYDPAWCVCSTLSFLKQANADELKFYEQYKPKRPQRAKSRMNDEFWRSYVYHGDMDNKLAAIFQFVSPAIAPLSALPVKKIPDLKKKEKIDLSNDQLHFANIFSYASSVLSVPSSDLYKGTAPGGLVIHNTTDRPSFIVGLDLLSGRKESELLHLIGKRLAYLRHEHFVNVVSQWSSSVLKVVVQSAIHAVTPGSAASSAEVDRISKEINRRLPQGSLEQLRRLINSFESGSLNLKRWIAAVDATSNRAAFLLTGDLDTAARIVAHEPALGGIAVSAKEKMKDLVVYSTSEPYFKARKKLGLSIG